MDKKEFRNLISSLLIFFLYFFVGILGFPEDGNIEAFRKIKIYYYIIGVLFILILWFVYRKDLKKNFIDFFTQPKKNILDVLKYFFIAFGGFFLLRLVASLLMGNDAVASQVDSVISDTYKFFPFYVLFQTIIYCQFVEEIIFRKVLGSIINNKWTFIIISSIIFAYLHLIGDYTSVFGYLLLFMPYFYLGCVLAYAYRKTNNVLVTIFIRLIYNGFVTLLIAIL